MGLIESIIMSTLDVLEYIIISSKLIQKDNICNHKNSKVILGIYILGFALAISFFAKYIAGKYSIVTSGILLVTMTFFVYRRKIKETIYTYIITMIVIISIQFSSIVLLRIFIVDLDYSFTSGIFVHIVTLFLTSIIYMYVPIDMIFKYVNRDNKVFKLLVLNMFIISISILLYWYVDVNGVFQNIAFLAAICSVIFVINLILLKNGLKNDIGEQKLKSYEGYLPVVDKDLRKKQHQCDNYIQKLRMLIITSEEKGKIIDIDAINKKDIKEENKEIEN
ncbi:hypothetical protein Curi_c06650 [Gottschalkia acidurici 9a]|uniref:Uncharacterized protein n=1 Tax=Gottschalkia acidurici (strain ATCC 7906 / DSM 604 / BCRC 14475 / CIP 104303 / KCTC 5404 / NCIMB 10678 / 9a) TaxID=1128398 RepID=K0AV50_GOTA9|nr:hypothetical protein [Gottschalkia acidurici]AFS77738.1 hypothetical protein Curi_c06650 [Gottschalkia acidurici 9a]